MRLRQRDKRLIVIRARATVQEPDGTTSEGDDWASADLTWDGTQSTWEDTGIPWEGWKFYGNVQPAGGRVMAEMYGDRLRYMATAYVEGAPPIKERSGAWIGIPADAPEPNYKVVAVRPWSGHTVIDMEVWGRG